MGVNQVQLRLSIDGKQVLSEMSAHEMKVKELTDANRKMSAEKTEQDNKLKENLKEIYKLQEKQLSLQKNMEAASSSGNIVQLSKLDEAYESNRVKLDELFDSQVKITEDFRCFPGLGRIMRFTKMSPEIVAKIQRCLGWHGLSLILEVTKD